MKGLIKVVMKSRFSSLSKSLEENEDVEGQEEQKDGIITLEAIMLVMPYLRHKYLFTLILVWILCIQVVFVLIKYMKFNLI